MKVLGESETVTYPSWVEKLISLSEQDGSLLKRHFNGRNTEHLHEEQRLKEHTQQVHSALQYNTAAAAG